MSEAKSFNNIDVTITGNVAWIEGLSWDVKILYGVIRGLTRNDYYCCYASNAYLAERMQKKPRTIRTFLNKLEELGVIQRDYGYIECDDGKVRRKRIVVPSELYHLFIAKRAEMRDVYETSKNMSEKGGKNLPTTRGKKLPPNIKCIPITNIKDNITPKPPYERGDNAATLTEQSQVTVLGKFGNVRLTELQRTAFKSEFGSTMELALIDQLDTYIESDSRKKKRFAKRSTNEIYATLRDWALRRTQPKQQSSAKVLIGGRDMERRPYSEAELDALYTDLNDDDTPK